MNFGLLYRVLNSVKKGNPLLKHIRNVKWMFADVVCDYLLGQTSCALYISLRYHLLHPDYLYFRIRELQKNFKLRVVLCHVDVEDVIKPLHEVTRTALLHDCTLLCAWSLEECGRCLETIKVYENKPADILQGQTDTDYLSRLNHALTTVRSVNKTDVVNLGSSFGVLRLSDHLETPAADRGDPFFLVLLVGFSFLNSLLHESGSKLKGKSEVSLHLLLYALWIKPLQEWKKISHIWLSTPV